MRIQIPYEILIAAKVLIGKNAQKILYVMVRTIFTNCTKETNQLTRSRVLGGSEQLVKSRVDHIGDIAQVQLLHKQEKLYMSTRKSITIRTK